MSSPNTEVHRNQQCVNNSVAGTSEEGQGNMAIDLTTLKSKPKANTPRPRYVPYKSIANCERTTIKIPNQHLEGEQHAKELAQDCQNKFKLLYEQGPRKGSAFSVIKTLVIDGCILFIIDLTPVEHNNIRKDVLEIVACLPEYLQHEEMRISCPRYRATLKNGRLIEVSSNLTKASEKCASANKSIIENAQSMGDLVCNNEPSCKVRFVDPPCLTHGMNDKVTIHTSGNMQNKKMRIVTAIGNKVVEDYTTDNKIHTTRLCIQHTDKDQSGSVQVLETDSKRGQIVGERAIFLILPEKESRELNDLFTRKVHSLHQESDCTMQVTKSNTLTSLDRCSMVWIILMKPLQTDMDYLLEQNLIDFKGRFSKSQKALDLYISIAKNVLSFLKEERLWACLTFMWKRLTGLRMYYDTLCPLTDAKLLSTLDRVYEGLIQGPLYEKWTVTMSMDGKVSFTSTFCPSLHMSGCSYSSLSRDSTGVLMSITH